MTDQLLELLEWLFATNKSFDGIDPQSWQNEASDADDHVSVIVATSNYLSVIKVFTQPWSEKCDTDQYPDRSQGKWK